MVKLWSLSDLPFRPKGRDNMKALRAQRRASPDLFLGAFMGSKLVGVVLGTDDCRKGWLNRLAVLPEARGKGVASALIKECEKALRRRGRRLFCVLIESYNTGSMDLFTKAGYKREEEILYFTKRERKDY